MTRWLAGLGVLMIMIGWMLCITPGGVNAQLAPPASVATADDIFSLEHNPAGLAINNGFQFGVAGNLENDFGDRYGLYFGGGQDHSSTAIGMRYDGANYTYAYSSASRITRGSYFGFNVNFGETMAPQYDFGVTVRPLKFLSLGANAMNVTENNGLQSNYRTGIAFRPFGSRLTVAADALFRYDITNDEYTTDFRGYLSTELINGLAVNAYYDNATEAVGVGFGINFPHHKAEAAMNVSDDTWLADGVGAYRFTTASMRSLFAPVKEDKFVLMELNGTLLEEKPRMTLFSSTRGRTVTSFILQLDDYAERKDLAGVVLYIKNLTGGPAQFQELRNALLRFRESGKKVYAYMDNGGNSQYYLASAADKVFMNPAGSLWLTGFSAQLMYVKELLGKVGVNAEFVHIGKYKSAGDMFTEDSTTEANYEQLSAYLDDLYETYTSDIAASRELSKENIKSIIDDGPYTPKLAMNAGLVDSLIYHDELKTLVTDDNDNGKYDLISENKYNRRGKWEYEWESPLSKKIAVIYAVGNIVTGKSDRSPFTGTISMGSETMAKAIRKARKDDTVKGILLRIDSPGGSGLASDIIWREIKLTVTGDNAKPFIVSMGDVAGSGGYYIAMAADTILADPGTITGSIGVIAGTFSFEELYNKLGVNTDIIKRGDNADFLSSNESMTVEEREKLYSMIQEFYQDFITKAAEDRGMTVDQMDSLGRGRIYSGIDAKEVGLIDEIGGFKEALKITKDAIGMKPDEEVAIEYYPKYAMEFFDMFNGTDILTQKVQEHPQLQQALLEIEKAELMANQEALYLLPFTVEIK